MQDNVALGNEKNSALEFYRVLFTFFICLHHAQYFISEIEWLKHAYVFVEFFFILSGYLLFNSFQREAAHSTIAYVKKRIRRLYPEYVYAAIISIVAMGIYLGDFNLSKAINELLMVQNTGLFHLGGYNYPCWYLSVMFVCGGFLYSALNLWFKPVTSFWIPLCVLLGYTYLGGLETGIENWQYVGCVSVPMIRGMCGMMLGVLVGLLHERGIMNRLDRTTCTLLEIFSLGFVVVGVATDYTSEMVSIIAIWMLILITVDGKGFLSSTLFNNHVWNYLGQYTYGAYLNHAVIIYVLSFINRHFYSIKNGRTAIFFISLIVYTSITHAVILKITDKISENFKSGI